MSPLNLSPRQVEPSEQDKLENHEGKSKVAQYNFLPKMYHKECIFLVFLDLLWQDAALAEDDAAEIAFGFGSVNQSAEQAAFPSLPQPMRQRHIRRTRDGWKIQGGSYDSWVLIFLGDSYLPVTNNLVSQLYSIKLKIQFLS